MGLLKTEGRMRVAGCALFIAAVFLIAFLDEAAAQAVPGLTATRVATGLSQPLFVTAPPGDYNRIFIVQKTGQVQILNLSTGALNATPFLDISARISTVSEQGLLGVAFDPNYSSNGKFYLNFVVPGGFWGNGTTHISQFQVSANADIADTSNEKILLTFDHPETNHNGGWIGFSPRSNDDHNLYIATGDGGNGNDQGTGHIEPGGNAQNFTTLLGKMLRIHVDPTTATVTIPSNNPFFGSNTNRQEIWLLGLRNPFRDSFDRANGRMFIGDVGQDTREEADVQQATNPGGGENYGWRDREGFIQNPAFATATPTPTPNPPRVNPIIDYPHPPPPSGLSGQTVIGGYIYRGRQIPTLTGTYVFGDYLGPESSSINPNNFGRIFTLNYDGSSASNPQDITSEIFTGTGFTLHNPTSFGEDANGELYSTDISTGVIYKIAPVTPNVITDSITRNAATGHIFVHGYGVPFKTHKVNATSDLSQQFGQINTVIAAGDGSFQYEDSSPGIVRFYQIAYP
jgi:glucose/arabinose dehydrogenase